MARIEGADPNNVDAFIKRTFEAQAKKWGATLLPYPVYARRPSIFKAVRGMWGALDESGLVDDALNALINRRVASHNGCVF